MLPGIAPQLTLKQKRGIAKPGRLTFLSRRCLAVGDVRPGRGGRQRVAVKVCLLRMAVAASDTAHRPAIMMEDDDGCDGAAQLRPSFSGGRGGALARYGVSELANTLVGRQYPLGTFVVNVLGCFLFGLIWELAAVRLLISDTVRLIILVGFMGSFTTFSSLIFDSFALGQTRLALLLFNIGAQTILGFAALFLGMTVGKHW